MVTHSKDCDESFQVYLSCQMKVTNSLCVVPAMSSVDTTRGIHKKGKVILFFVEIQTGTNAP